MNDELTPDERAAMRARIVGGARDIKPAGAHRNTVIAGSIAAVLVVAIAGGVAATSTLSAPEIATTPSPTATAAPVPTPATTPAPTSTPTPTPTENAGRAPFDGSCQNVLTADQLTSVTGHEMSDVTFVPHDSRFTLRGGIFCDWASSDEYQGALLTVAVLAADQQLPALEADWFADPECPSDATYCTFSWSDDALQIHIRVRDSARADQRAEMAATIADMVRTRFVDYPAGVAEPPTDAWWSPWTCGDLSSSIDAGALGSDTVRTQDAGSGTYPMPGVCEVTLSQADGHLRATASIVPGGAVGLDAMVASAYASETVSVSGATAAYWVELQSGYDGGGVRELWVTDGVNLLTVGAVVSPAARSLDATPDLSILLAEQLLPTL